jgi:hypothetical protein
VQKKDLPMKPTTCKKPQMPIRCGPSLVFSVRMVEIMQTSLVLVFFIVIHQDLIFLTLIPFLSSASTFENVI